VEAVTRSADGGIAVLFANLGTGTGTGTFALSQLGINTPEASGYNVWRNETTTFSGVTVTLPAGQTETMVMKPVG
jgi:alpha-galactosidase